MDLYPTLSISRIDCNPDQEKAFTEQEWMNELIFATLIVCNNTAVYLKPHLQELATRGSTPFYFNVALAHSVKLHFHLFH